MSVDVDLWQHYHFYGFSNRDHVYKLLKKAKSNEVKIKTVKHFMRLQLLNVSQFEGETPLFAAVINGDVNKVKELLGSSVTSQEINMQDKFGFTVLHCACNSLDPNEHILKV